MPTNKTTTSEELLEKEIDDEFENYHITRKWLKDFVLQKQKEAYDECLEIIDRSIDKSDAYGEISQSKRRLSRTIII